MRIRLILFVLLFSNITALNAQNSNYTGSWTKVNTTYVFDFVLSLRITENNQVTGVFNWQVIRADENSESSTTYYTSKIGKTAKEYVRGTYDPVRDIIYIHGYKKEDPDAIIGLDYYKLVVDDEGSIGGTTRTNGSWLGRIHGKLEGDFL